MPQNAIHVGRSLKWPVIWNISNKTEGRVMCLVNFEQISVVRLYVIIKVRNQSRKFYSPKHRTTFPGVKLDDVASSPGWTNSHKECLKWRLQQQMTSHFKHRGNTLAIRVYLPPFLSSHLTQSVSRSVVHPSINPFFLFLSLPSCLCFWV